MKYMEVKGTAIAALPVFIQEKFGQERYQAWLFSLPEKSRLIYEKSILISKWYLLSDAYGIPTKKMCEMFYEGRISGAWDAGCYDADYGLKGVYSIFVKWGTPSFIIKQSSKIFSAYFNPSKLIVVDSKEQSAAVRIEEFSEMNEYIEQRIGGYMQRALELNGCREVKVEIIKLSKNNNTAIEYRVIWQ